MGSGMRGLRFSVLVSVSCFLFGCAGLFHSNAPLTATKPEDLVRKIRDHASQLQTFIGRGILLTVSSEGGFRGSMRVFVKMPDSLFIHVEGPLGMDVMKGWFAAGWVSLYYPRENILYEGSVRAMQENGLLPLYMDFRNVVMGVVGLLVPDGAGLDSLLDFSSNDKKYTLSFENGEDVWVEPKGPVVTRWEKKDEDGVTLWVWEGEDFRKHGGIRFPKKIWMTSYEPKQQVTLFFESVKTNRPLKKDWYAMLIPEGVEKFEF